MKKPTTTNPTIPTVVQKLMGAHHQMRTAPPGKREAVASEARKLIKQLSKGPRR